LGFWSLTLPFFCIMSCRMWQFYNVLVPCTLHWKLLCTARVIQPPALEHLGHYQISSAKLHKYGNMSQCAVYIVSLNCAMAWFCLFIVTLQVRDVDYDDGEKWSVKNLHKYFFQLETISRFTRAGSSLRGAHNTLPVDPDSEQDFYDKTMLISVHLRTCFKLRMSGWLVYYNRVQSCSCFTAVGSSNCRPSRPRCADTLLTMKGN